MHPNPCRLESERAADQSALQHLARALSETSVTGSEIARRADETAHSLRDQLTQRQAALVTELASLGREVDGYRAEAAAAGSSLHTAVERLHGRLAGEEAALEALAAGHMRQEQAEAAQIGLLRGQVGELGALVSALQGALAGEANARRQDAQAFELRFGTLQVRFAWCCAGGAWE